MDESAAFRVIPCQAERREIYDSAGVAVRVEPGTEAKSPGSDSPRREPRDNAEITKILERAVHASVLLVAVCLDQQLTIKE